MTEDIEELKAAERSDSKPTRRRDSGWMWGGILIVVGAALLVSNFTQLHFDNWWALIVLALGVRGLWNAWDQRHAAGGWNNRARHGLIWGAIVSLAGLIFLFNWSWSTLWPLVIIIIGVGSLLPSAANE